MTPSIRAAPVFWLYMLAFDSDQLVTSEVDIKILKDTNIGWGHGTGKESPGQAVAGYPAVIFYNRVESTSDCQVPRLPQS